MVFHCYILVLVAELPKIIEGRREIFNLNRRDPVAFHKFNNKDNAVSTALFIIKKVCFYNKIVVFTPISLLFTKMFVYVCVCVCVCVYIYIYIYTYRVSQEECARLRESVPYVKLYRYNPKHLCPK